MGTGADRKVQLHPRARGCHHQRVEGDGGLDSGDRVPMSWATVAIDTFMTELSSVIKNWPEASNHRAGRQQARLETCSASWVFSAARRLRGPHRGGGSGRLGGHHSRPTPDFRVRPRDLRRGLVHHRAGTEPPDPPPGVVAAGRHRRRPDHARDRRPRRREFPSLSWRKLSTAPESATPQATPSSRPTPPPVSRLYRWHSP